MSILNNINDLNLSFVKDLKSELMTLEESSSNLKNEYNANIDNFDSDDANLNTESAEIIVGCKVEVSSTSHQLRIGRVLENSKNKNETFRIRIEGFNGTHYASRTSLKNISIGYLPVLERKIWVTEAKIKDIKEVLIDSESPI